MIRRGSKDDRSRGVRRSWMKWVSPLLITVCVAFSFTPGVPSASGASNLANLVVASIGSSPRTSGTGLVANGPSDPSEPSRQAPMGPSSLPGYKQTYVTDFTGNSLPAGWSAYSGIPGGDPGAHWALSHVTVSGGLLQLNTWQDPAYGGEWVAGGLCQCGAPRTYGAYFVRSRVTGAGPTQVELLWPATGWPPEVDFNETNGGTSFSLATLHFTSANSQIHSTVNIDMTQWHTWGVIWTPTSVTYTVDGNVWGQVNSSADVPRQPMTLDLQQQTWCAATPSPACPTTPVSMQVDWVSEYKSVTASSTTTTTTAMVVPTTTPSSTSNFNVGPFAANSATLTKPAKNRVINLARRIKASSDSKVVLTGYSDRTPSKANSPSTARARALAVEKYLRRLLRNLHVTGVAISMSGASHASSIPSTSTPSG